MTDSGMLAHYQEKPKPRLVSCGPAYGRDYTTREEVIAAWEEGEGLDFQIYDLQIRGTYVSKRDDITGLTLKLRYNNLQDFVLVNEDGSVVEDDGKG